MANGLPAGGLVRGAMLCGAAPDGGLGRAAQPSGFSGVRCAGAGQTSAASHPQVPIRNGTRLIWLVLWNMTFILPYIGIFIIPIDSYFSEDLKPPASYGLK